LRGGLDVALDVRKLGEKMHTIDVNALARVSGGQADGDKFHGAGTMTRSACFSGVGRAVAHANGLTGPWKPHSAMRPEDHLMKDRKNNEAGVANWARDPKSKNLGECTLYVY
jgi:hypothetical protein